ncbi:phytoene/squalene synthase family protein [Sporichthya sp.]|uniref:phytoene/squalene synthase family protein n=1 Tax=Sporichthya sp. TaxID=65475 RepID=UPI0018279BA4|nr:phytoene/squalene synthase family protein [Sporichthya sp.]MBA3745141.1 phytoene/squalene synthase family protein [Sporichthya sp.]
MPSRAALDAAGITDPRLRASYLRCQELHARYGRTYYLATLLLPPARRPHVWALYGFARHADEIVDDVSGAQAQRAEHFEAWSTARLAEFERGHSDDEVGRAAVHTARTWDIPPAHTEAFLAAMRADLTVATYPRFDDLLTYMHGSAAVIGLQMLPLLRPADPEAAAEPARALGIAFQLTNFLRDVGEDLGRGRLYLPAEDLAAHGVTRADLERGEHSDAIRDLMAFQVTRARSWYAAAAPGVAMLHPDSRACIQAATRLYGGILKEIEANDYRVLDRRARVGLPTRLRVGVGAYARARRSWRAPSQVHQPSVQSASANPNSRSSAGA